MRRRRAGPTSPKLSQPSMSLQFDIGNVGQCETKAATASTEKATTNSASNSNTGSEYWQRKARPFRSNNLSTRSKSHESSLPTAFDFYNASKFLSISTPDSSLNSTEHASTPLSVTAIPIISFPATTTTVSAPTTTTATTSTTANSSTTIFSRPEFPKSDDDGSSSDDELPTTNFTVFHNNRLPIPCIHSLSSTKSFNPKRFIRCPYRKTLLSLLCRVRTSPTDGYASDRQSTNADRIQVYACYQQHWNPKFNIPVLTLVACCNVNIAQPILERTEPDKFNVTFMCTSSKEQHKMTFKMPLFTSLDSINNPIMLKIGPHHPLPESLTSWMITYTDSEVALSWIKVWHLSPMGCFNLHNHGIIIPQRPFPEAEVHFLGLTGKRKMPFRINQLELVGTFLPMIDPIDLGNIGYKRYTAPQKPTLPNNGTLVTALPIKAFPRNNISPDWHYDNGLIARPEIKLKRWPNLEPIHYPPPFDYSIILDEFPDPLVFQEGESVFRTPLILSTTTLEDMITEAVKKNPREDPINTLMTYFNIRRQDIETRYMKKPFTRFLQEKQLSPSETNGKCVFEAYCNGHNTGERFLVPKIWFHIHQHPVFCLQ